MSTTERPPAGVLRPGLPIREDPALAFGRALPNVPWFIPRIDRKYNVIIPGGQGSGKSSILNRLALNDIYDPTTCTVVLDMKGSLSERLLKMSPDTLVSLVPNEDGELVEGRKRVWYLDLAHPLFGMTPLRVEAGWTRNTLAEEFARIADAMTRVLLDLFPNQIMGSSEEIIERSTVGAMAIAWWEHEQDCAGRGVDPATESFIGSVEVLAHMLRPTASRVVVDPSNVTDKAKQKHPPNPWHVAAGKACNMLPNLDTVADDFLFGIPARVRENLSNVSQRMEAPANKIRPLVGASVMARRFVEHRYHLSISEVVRRRDVLIVNPRLNKIGEDQAAIICNFIVHLIDQEMKRQVEQPAHLRPRVSLVADEAHRLITETLVTMIATHREAGFDCAFAVQFLAQIGAGHPDASVRQKMHDGVGNLMQHKIIFRSSSPEDAEYFASMFRSVYETMHRADPESRARTPADPARISAISDWNALVSLISSARGGTAGGTTETLAGTSAAGGANRLPVFTTETYEMPEPDALSDAWSRVHMDRQLKEFPDYPENMSQMAHATPPPGLLFDQTAMAPTPFEERMEASHQAADVAAQHMGNIPGRDAPGAPEEAADDLWTEAELAAMTPADDVDSGTAAWAREVEKTAKRRPLRGDKAPGAAPDTSSKVPPAGAPQAEAGATANDHVHINTRRSDPSATVTPRDDSALQHALLPTDGGPPPEELPILAEVVEAAKAHAGVEAADGRTPWILYIVEEYAGVADKLLKAARRVVPGPAPTAPDGPNPLTDKPIMDALEAAHGHLAKVAAAAGKTASARDAGSQIEPLIHHVRDDLAQAMSAYRLHKSTNKPLLEELKRLQGLYGLTLTYPGILTLLQQATQQAGEANTDAATSLIGQGVGAIREALLKLQALPVPDGAGVAIEGPLEAIEDATRKLDAAVSKHRLPTAQVAADLKVPLAETLAVAARVNYVSQPVLAELRDSPVAERTMRRHLNDLEALGLIALTLLQVPGRRGRGQQLYTVTARGRSVLRDLHKKSHPNATSVPRELAAERKAPADSRQGNNMRHDVAVQVATAAVRHAVSREVSARWITENMSGGFFDPNALLRDAGGLTEEHLMPAPGLKATGAQMPKATKIHPDVSLQLTGPVNGTRQIVDLMLEVDLTGRGSYNDAKFAAYDHFLGGWYRHTRRYGAERKRRPIVLFVARTTKDLPPLLVAADAQMRLGFSAQAVYDPAAQWYPGREHLAITTVDWLVGGQLRAVALDPLPPSVRGTDTKMTARFVDIVPPSWWAAKPVS
jgi:HAMP domain-containing protein